MDKSTKSIAPAIGSKTGIYVNGVVISNDARTIKLKDGTTRVSVKHEIALDPGLIVLDRFMDPKTPCSFCQSCSKELGGLLLQKKKICLWLFARHGCRREVHSEPRASRGHAAAARAAGSRRYPSPQRRRTRVNRRARLTRRALCGASCESFHFTHE